MTRSLLFHVEADTIKGFYHSNPAVAGSAPDTELRPHRLNPAVPPPSGSFDSSPVPARGPGTADVSPATCRLRYSVITALLLSAFATILSPVEVFAQAKARIVETATIDRNSEVVTMPVPGSLQGKKITFFAQTKTARGGLHCGGWTDFINREVRFDEDDQSIVNGTIFIRKTLTGSSVSIPIKLCPGSDGKTFDLVWDTYEYPGHGKPSLHQQREAIFDSTAPNCADATKCHTTITIAAGAPPVTPVASFASASSSAGEAAGTHNVTVNLGPAPTSDITLTYTVSGTATKGNDFSISGSGSLSVPLGATTAIIPVTMIDDSADESNETVILALTSGNGYTVASNASRHTLTILDDDKAPQAKTYATLIAQMVEWRNDPRWRTYKSHTDRWDRALLAFGKSVSDSSLTPMTAAEAQAFADRGWTRWVEVAKALHEIERGGTVAVRDDGEPVVSIAGGSAITEGGTATFTLSAVPPPPAALTVTVDVVDSGDFANSGQTGAQQVTIGTGGTGTLTVITNNDTTDESDGTLTVTIASGQGYTPSTTSSAASVAVNDDDTAPPVDCVNNAQWNTVQGYYSHNSGKAPNYGANWYRVLIAYKQARSDKTLPHWNGATVRPTTPYTVAEAEAGETVWSGWTPVREVLECLESSTIAPPPPPKPTVTVTGGSGVTEGDNAVFTVAADPAPAAPLTVTLTVDDDATSDFLAQGDKGTQTVTIQAGQPSATLTLATVDDSTDEPHGSVSATVSNGNGYAVGNPATATVAVSDDDDPLVTTPVVRLAGGSGMTEGGAASFTLTATPTPTGVITVTVDVTDSGSFAASGQTGTKTVTISTTGTATLTVATADDAINEADGRITATVQTGTGYAVADPPHDTASVTVTDDDDPVVRLAGGSGVTEGRPATFTLTSTPAPAAPLTVTLTIAQSGDYTASDQTGTREVVIPTEGSVTLEVATVNDTTDEPNGSVQATVTAGSGYTVAASPDDTAAVAVADDDVAVAGVPTLSVNDVEVKEGPYRRVEFTVTLSKATREGASFYWRVRESTPVSAKRNSDFWASSQKKFAFIRPGETAYKVMAALVIDDSHDEDPETFEVVLSDARGAALADAVGVATIVNSDPMPQAWLGRLGRTLAQQALDGITGRLTAPRTPGAQGTLAGQAFSLRPGGTETPTADPTTPAPSVLERLAALVLPGLTAGGAGGMGADPAFGGADPLFGGGLGDGDAGAPGFRGGGLTPQSLNLRDLLLGSSFTATGQPDAWGGSVALWGRAALATFDGQEDTFALDGEVLTGLLGVDYARDRWLLGVSLLQSASTGGYLDRNTGASPCPAHDLSAEMRQLVCDGAVRAGDGKVEATLTAAVPYAAFQASERLNLWGAAGYGAGEVTLTPETGDALKTDLDWTMAQMGVRGTVLAPVADDSGLAGGPALAVTSDALWARTTSEKVQDGLAASESDVTRLRLGLEGSWLMALEDLGQVTPKLAVGARHDGGDAETGFGVELGGGLAWAMPTAGLALNVEGRTLLTHREEAFQDQGVAASLVFDPDPATPRGPSLALRQDWGGAATGGVEALFASAPLAQRQGTGTTGATRRWAADMAWGFPAWDGAFTSSPLVGLGLAPGSRDYRLGWRLVPATAASAFALEVQATRREPDAAIPEHRVGLELSTRW